MVVWLLTGGLVLIGKVRYECSGAEGREETKPTTTWHEDPSNRHTLKQAVKSNWASYTSVDPTFFTKRYGTLLPTGHNEYCTFLLVFTHYRENHHSRGKKPRLRCSPDTLQVPSMYGTNTRGILEVEFCMVDCLCAPERSY